MRNLTIFFVLSLSSVIAAGACSSSDSSNGGSGGHTGGTSGTGGGNSGGTSGGDSGSDATLPAESCVKANEPGNELGVGKSCSPGGGECDAFPDTICLADLGQPQWFCAIIGCSDNSQCGSGSDCHHDPLGSACVPIKCETDGGSDGGADASTGGAAGSSSGGAAGTASGGAAGGA
jgi:hypothetical protein